MKKIVSLLLALAMVLSCTAAAFAFSDVNDSLSLAEKGAVLSPGKLLQVAEVLRSARNARAQLVTEQENTPLITAEASQLKPNQALERDITDAIISEETSGRICVELLLRTMRIIDDVYPRFMHVLWG